MIYQIFLNVKKYFSLKIYIILLTFICFTFLTGLNSVSYAQEIGNLTGFVKDAQTGKPLPGASVLLKGTSLGDATDTNGYYRITDIPSGTYTVIVRFVGYKPATKYNIVIKSEGNADINFELEPTTLSLEELTVTPDFFSTEPATPLSTQTLSGVEIASYPGGNNDIARVVQSLAGVSGSVGFRNDIIIRGGAPSENVYYLDNIEIPIINHFATQGSGGGPVSILNVAFFEGVTLIASSFPARYDNMLSGVIQFALRNGNPSEFQGNVRISSTEAAVTVEGPLFKSDDETYSNTTFITSVRRSYLQLLFQLIDLPFLPSYWDYQYKLHHQINKFNEINIIGVGSIDDFSINVPDNITAEQRATLDQIPLIEQWTSTAGVSWKKRFKNTNGYLLTSVSTSVFDNSFSRYRNNIHQTGLIQRTESRQWWNTVKTEYNRYLDEWVFSAGIMIENKNYSTHSFSAFKNNRFEAQLNFFHYGAFTQIAKKWLNGRLTASFGIRSDINTFTGGGMKFWQTLSPRLALSYELDADGLWEINASVGRYYKIPSLTILGYKSDSGVFINQDADYIRSDHYVAGISYTPRKSTQFTIEGFLKLYNNYPVSVDDSLSLANLGGGYGVVGNQPIESMGKGRTYGIEFTYRQKLIDDFYAILAYTLYWSEFTGFNEDKYLPSVWDNRHLLSLTGGYKFGAGWEFGSRLRIRGGVPYPTLKRQITEKTYPKLVFDYSNLGEKRLDAFYALDVRISKQWNFSQWALETYIDMQNVTGTNIPTPPQFGLKRDESGTIIQPPQIVKIKETTGSAVLPSIGIVVDF